MNRFISQNTEGDMSNLVFVDSLDDYYEDETKTPVQHPSSTSSPFKGKTPHECYLLLRQLVRNTKSRIDWEQSVIVDEQSLQVSVRKINPSDSFLSQQADTDPVLTG